MKDLQKCGLGKLCVFLITLLCAFTSVSAQDYSQQRQAFLDSLGLSDLGTELFLNAALTNENEVSYFWNLFKKQIGVPEKVSAEEFQNFYERIVDADLRKLADKMPAYEKLTETDPNKIARSNEVPIGILNLSSIYLTGSEISSSKKAKTTGSKFDFGTVDQFNIVYASVLREDVYQADVFFRLDETLYISNQAAKPESITLDFGEGEGYQNFSLAQKIVSHHFKRIGLHKILIRFELDQKTFVFETAINVRQLEREAPFKEFAVTAQRITPDTTSDSSARTALVGGNIRIILGCDKLLNKPIIVAEGFDMGNDLNLDYIESRYHIEFRQYLAEGYDLILLDYSDGRAAIQDNAQVLKALIQQVNQMKSGNNELIVVGESMSGLVARWALKEMENEGTAHHVKLMICYDTPHQGANVPVGLTQLNWDAPPTMLSQFILKFFTKGWRNYYKAMSTPAAQQLLLHWGGALNGGVGSKSPMFDSFRVQLNALGNGGYPEDSRNIAISHGSLNASDRDIFQTYNYGSRILRSWLPWGLQNANLDIHTNALSQNKNVFRFASWGLFSKVIGISRSYNSTLNEDFLPGGTITFPVPNKLFKPLFESGFQFCFVPTFSSIDYQGPRTEQEQRELLNVFDISPLQTPFDAIYGGKNTPVNTNHVATSEIDWEFIGIQENLIVGGTACPPKATPPVPAIAIFNTCYPFNEKRTTEDNTASITVSLITPSNGKYIHNWTVLPSNEYFTTVGDQITFHAERPDYYEITCVRTYPDRSDISSKAVGVIHVVDCDGITVLPEDQLPLEAIDITDVWENDFLLTTEPQSLPVFAHYTPKPGSILYATQESGVFVSKAQLQAFGMFEEFAALFASVDPREALPVKLSSFTANVRENTVVLDWQTTQEIDNDYFEVQRSRDGKTWEVLAQVPARHSPDGGDYQCLDSLSEKGDQYYRLKMVDLNKSYAYSNICLINLAGDAALTVFPNPIDFGEELEFSVKKELISLIQIFDTGGKLHFECAPALLQSNLNKLRTGLYIMQIHLKDGSATQRTLVRN